MSNKRNSIDIKLISTDFDGTIHDGACVPQVAKEFNDFIREFQSKGGVWVVNTGRNLKDTVFGIEESNLPNPDYLVVEARDIYQFKNSRFEGVQEWNEKYLNELKEIKNKYLNNLMNDFIYLKNTLYPNLYLWQEPWCFCGAICDSAEVAIEVYHKIIKSISDIGGLEVAINGNMIWVVLGGYHKGSALQKIQQITSVGPENTVAAGDNINDFSMLDLSVAKYLVCPVNALESIKRHVNERGGYSSEKRAAMGILDGIVRIFKTSRASIRERISKAYN